MNKLIKGIIAFFGGIEVVFNLFLPIFVITLLVIVINLSSFNTSMLIFVGIGATIFRVIKLFIK